MREIQNDCCGCPELGCINCEKGKDYEAVTCDICGAGGEDMYEYNGKDYCEECLFEVWFNENIEDISILIKPTWDLKECLEYLAECVTDNPNELYSYLSEADRKKFNDFRNNCEIH